MIVLGLVACGWYFGIYGALSTSIMRMSADITEIHAQEKITLQKETRGALESDVDVLRCSLRDYNSVWKTKGIETLLEPILAAGLTFISSDVTTHQREPWCIEDTITLRLNGSGEQVSKFFSLLASHGNSIVCEQLEISSDDGKQYSLCCALTALTSCSC